MAVAEPEASQKALDALRDLEGEFIRLRAQCEHRGMQGEANGVDWCLRNVRNRLDGIEPRCERPTPEDPECYYCGVPRVRHGIQPHNSMGLHYWTRPPIGAGAR